MYLPSSQYLGLNTHLGEVEKGSHVYVMFIVAHGTTIVTSYFTIVTKGHHGSIRTTFVSNSITRKLATGSIHDYLFCYCPLVGILFEVLRIL